MKNGSRKFFSCISRNPVHLPGAGGHQLLCGRKFREHTFLPCPDTKAPASAPISSSLLPDGKTVDTLSNAHMMDWLLPGFVEPEVDLASIQPRTYEISASKA